MTERERLIETYAKRFWNARHVAAIRELLNEFESDLVSLNRGSDETQAVRPNEQTKEGCELCMGNGVIESDWDGGGFTAKCDCKAN